MGDMSAVFVLVSFATCLGWIVWVLSNNRRRSRIAETQNEMQIKLFEKFGTSQELVEYLKTEAGSKFLSSATIEQAKPSGRILGSVQAGLILFFLGIAMLFVRYTMPPEGFNAIERAQTAHGFLAVSFLLLALGLGFLASAAASYRISKSWGLFERESARQR